MKKQNVMSLLPWPHTIVSSVFQRGSTQVWWTLSTNIWQFPFAVSVKAGHFAVCLTSVILTIHRFSLICWHFSPTPSLINLSTRQLWEQCITKVSLASPFSRSHLIYSSSLSPLCNLRFTCFFNIARLMKELRRDKIHFSLHRCCLTAECLQYFLFLFHIPEISVCSF